MTERLKPVDHIEVGIIGAGVVGLAIGYEFAQRGHEVVVFERTPFIGFETSSRNSEVLHCGIYYPPGSLKAETCVQGQQLLYEYSQVHDIPHNAIGKLIVATTDDEVPKLEQLFEQARKNGVNDIIWLMPQDIHELEPSIHAVKALYSPKTGIIDSHKLMQSLKDGIEKHGGYVQLFSPVLEGEIQDRHMALSLGGRNPMVLTFDIIVNSAGLYAQQVARAIRGLRSDTIPQEYYAKGQYYILNRKSPFTHLVYPVPVAGGLGIHATLDLSDSVRFGPNVIWVDRPNDYAFDPSYEEEFYRIIRVYYPELSDGSLQSGYIGIRPKLAGPHEPNQDFIIQGLQTHGIQGLVNLYGIESPGLTASLALAGIVYERAHS